MSGSHESTSKFLSYVLRHAPDAIGLAMPDDGWFDLDTLIEHANAHGRALTRPLVESVVATNAKRRFALSADGARIRANQGHSIPIRHGLDPVVPPDVLFHGTATRFVDAIRREGLSARSRQHVHLSALEATAIEVGRRHGTPVVLRIDARAMHVAGHRFYRADNGVFLCDAVPAEFVRDDRAPRPDDARE